MSEVGFERAFERTVAVQRGAMAWRQVAVDGHRGVFDGSRHVQRITEAALPHAAALARAPLSAYADGYNEATGSITAPLVKAAVMTIGGVDELPALTFRPSFTLTHDRAIQFAGRRGAELVNRIGIESVTNLRSLIEQALREKLTVDETYALIRDLNGFGLFPRWANAVRNRYAHLRSKGVPASRALAQSKAYELRLIRARARMIARTEVNRALNEGKLVGWNDQGAAGLFDTNVARKEWRTGAVGPSLQGVAVCPVCQLMQNVSVPLDEPFVTEYGVVDMPPAHPSCRCTAVLLPLGLG